MGNCPDRVIFEADYAVEPGQVLTPVAFDFVAINTYRLGLDIEGTRFVNLPPSRVLVWQDNAAISGVPGGIEFNGIWYNDGQQRDDEGHRVLTGTLDTSDLIASASCHQGAQVYVHVLNPTRPDLEWFLCTMTPPIFPSSEWGIIITPSTAPPPPTAAYANLQGVPVVLPRPPATGCTSCRQQRQEQQEQQQQQQAPVVSASSSAASIPYITENIATVVHQAQQQTMLSNAIDDALQRDPQMPLCKFVNLFQRNAFETLRPPRCTYNTLPGPKKCCSSKKHGKKKAH